MVPTALCYDLDVSYVMPAEMFDDPNHARMAKLAGIELDSRSNYVAKFRDPATVQAIVGASATVRAYLEACGIALVPSGIALPAGCFDERFDDHLGDIVERMRENIANFGLDDQHWNGFELGECAVAIGAAQPVAAPPPSVAGHTQNRKSRLPLYPLNLLRNPKLFMPLLALAAAAGVHLLVLDNLSDAMLSRIDVTEFGTAPRD